MPRANPDAIEELGKRINDEVTAVLEEANEILPSLREIDQTLYTSVDVRLAIAYTMATSYMYESVRGAAEVFTSMNEALAATAQSWADADESAARDLS